MLAPDEWARMVASRAEQGLPPTVQDPAALERAAAALRVMGAGSVMPSPWRRKARTATVVTT